MTLDGVGRRCLWPAVSGWYTEDDFWVEPHLGLAIVAGGLGAIGGQGKPAAKLAVWSVAGECGATTGTGAPPSSSGLGESAETRLRRGLERAKVAVERLSANWPPGLGKPVTSLAVLLLDGPTALVAHIGDCQVARLGPDGLCPLTRPHTLGNEAPPELANVAVPPELAGVLVRVLGGPGAPEIQRIPVEPGDTFVLTTRRSEETLPRPALERALRRLAPNNIVTDNIASDNSTSHNSTPGNSTSGDIESVMEDLVRDARARAAEARFTVVIAKVGGAPGPASRGSSEAPRQRWLFAPGEPLADAPPEWAAGSAGRGPDAKWFSDVFDPVMGPAPTEAQR